MNPSKKDPSEVVLPSEPRGGGRRETKSISVWMDLRGEGAPSPGSPAPQHPPLGRDGVGGALTRVSSASRGQPGKRVGRHSLAGMPPRREASRDLQAAFYGAESGSEKRPSFPQIMQGTVPARAPPRMAGTARNTPAPTPGTPGKWGVWPGRGCRQRRTRAQRPCPRSGGCLRTSPASAPGLELQIPAHTWGERQGMARGDSAFHLQQHWGGRGAAPPKAGPELLNLSGTAVCLSHKPRWGCFLEVRRACYSLKQVL